MKTLLDALPLCLYAGIVGTKVFIGNWQCPISSQTHTQIVCTLTEGYGTSLVSALYAFSLRVLVTVFVWFVDCCIPYFTFGCAFVRMSL